MNKTMTIGKQLALGFGLILIALAVTGIWSFLGMHSTVKEAEEVIHGNKLKTNITQREIEHLNWAESVSDYLFNDAIHELKAQTDPHQCAFGKWYYSEGRSQMEKLAPSTQTPLKEIEHWHNQLHASASEIATAEPDAAKRIYFEKTKPGLERVQQYLGEMQTCINQYVKTDEQMLSDAHRTQAGLSTLSITAILLGIAIAYFISRHIRQNLSRITRNISMASEQVASASGQVNSASQCLAEGATEQAAGLEETASSLEEMTSMTRSNSTNAKEANALASETRAITETGSEAMQKMNLAISDIQNSSAETAKIIKVIDEIAFQTNLLALNAAVEAARAGEAGKGFAVVAEEVRNLAKHSAEAAKTTSELIEGSVNKSSTGVQIAAEVGNLLENIRKNITKTAELVSEITASTEEQAQGIQEINGAVTQIDQVTQSNAANAEQSASAAQELSAQAGGMNELVKELNMLAGNA
jgi:methyl-accepting chemotaxis protein